MKDTLRTAARWGDWVTAYAIAYVQAQWTASGIDRE